MQLSFGPVQSMAEIIDTIDYQASKSEVASRLLHSCSHLVLAAEFQSVTRYVLSVVQNVEATSPPWQS